MFSGHIVCEENQLHRVDSGDNENRVIQILSNYLDRPYSGGSWLRINRFIPEKNQIILTAPPFLDRYDDSIEHAYFRLFDMSLDK